MPGSRRPARLRAPATVATLVLAVLVFSACSDSSPLAQSGTGPNPASPNGLVPEAFAELPKPGTARPLDVPTSTANAVLQSYEVAAMQPGELVNYYLFRLPRLGWTPASGTHNVGRLGTKSVWKRDHLRLEVTAIAQDPTLSEASLATGPTQLDLVLTHTGR
jgi:hypothetical protein